MKVCAAVEWRRLTVAVLVLMVALGAPTFADDGDDDDDDESFGPILVDCSSGSLQAAIDRATSGDTIFFEGTCNEGIVIRIDGLTLDGDPDGDAVVDGTIIGSVTVIGAQRVALRNFGVDNSPLIGFAVGIEAVDGAVATVDNVTVDVEDDFVIGLFANRNAMIQVSNSTVMTANLASTCDSAAVNANANSIVVSDGGNTFTNDDDAGVCASNDSYYRQNSGTNDTIDAPHPVVAFDSSLADIRGANINSTGPAGELVVGGSSMLRIRNSDLHGSDITLKRLSACRLRSSVVNLGNINFPLSGSGDASFCLPPS